MGFCHLYFKIATALGGFQELGRMYFDIMRNSMFDDDRGNKVNNLYSILVSKLLNYKTKFTYIMKMCFSFEAPR